MLLVIVGDGHCIVKTCGWGVDGDGQLEVASDESDDRDGYHSDAIFFG